MIVIKLMGGLGNQMFQFAFAFTYLLEGMKVKFDISAYEIDSRHGGYCLERTFNLIEIEKSTKRDIFHFIEKAIDTDGTRGYQFKENAYLIEETPELPSIPTLSELEHTYLIGYWQHVNYFQHQRKALLKLFKFKAIADDDLKNKSIEAMILSQRSISLHIRRTDYLDTDMYTHLSTHYYQNAIEKIKSKISNPYFFVFSDDIEWAKDHIKADHIFFISGNDKEKSHIDMYLMSICKHHIIANSTFSWWAAWLNENEEKTVIMPKEWFKAEPGHKGLALDNWIKL